MKIFVTLCWIAYFTGITLISISWICPTSIAHWSSWYIHWGSDAKWFCNKSIVFLIFGFIVIKIFKIVFYLLHLRRVSGNSRINCVLSFSFKSSYLFLNFIESVSKNILAFFNSFTNFINFDFLSIRISSSCLFPKLSSNIFIKYLTSGKVIEKLIILASSYIRVRIETLLLVYLSDFFNAEHNEDWIIIRKGVFTI